MERNGESRALSFLGLRLPQFVTERVETWRRDLHMLTEGFAGRHPSPVDFRERRAAAVSFETLRPRLLRVTEVIRETPDAVTLHLVDSIKSAEPFWFEAGQFLTVMLPLGENGELVRRAYSASSSPLDLQAIAITSKRVAGGKVSNYLNDRVVPGMLIQALGPSGNFTPQPHADKKRHLVLIGGGSGITPLMSILQTVLRIEPESRVSLLYGNRGTGDIIFYQKLSALCATHGERLFVRHVLEKPPADWPHGIGMLDEKVLEKELPLLPQDVKLATEYYLCGPAPMMTAARTLLLQKGVLPSSILEERFASLRYAEDETTTPQPATLKLYGGRIESLTVQSNETLLEAGLRTGAGMPFSCAMGGCGACKGRLVSGEVTMQEPNCLTDAERQAGFVLCCVARPRTPVTVAVGVSDGELA